MNTLSFQEIESYSRVMNTTIRPWEVRMIKKIDLLMLESRT